MQEKRKKKRPFRRRRLRGSFCCLQRLQRFYGFPEPWRCRPSPSLLCFQCPTAHPLPIPCSQNPHRYYIYRQREKKKIVFSERERERSDHAKMMGSMDWESMREELWNWVREERRSQLRDDWEFRVLSLYVLVEREREGERLACCALTPFGPFPFEILFLNRDNVCGGHWSHKGRLCWVDIIKN